MTEYNSVIDNQAKQGIIERVPEFELNSPQPGSVHYLPHHEVVRSDKSTTRVRIVYDWSSKRKNEVSLNETLYGGPPLTPLILDILLRFRMFSTVLIGDLEKAFLSIRITPEQRDLLRFIWVDDITKDNPNLVVFQFLRLIFGLNTSPFILNGTIRHHLSKYVQEDPEFLKVLRSLYVDDLISGTESRQDSFEFYLKLKHRFAEGNMNMRKWNSNDKDLLRMIEDKEQALIPSPPVVKSENEIEEEDESFAKSLFSPLVLKMKQKYLG